MDDWLNHPRFKLANEQMTKRRQFIEEYIVKSHSTYLFDIEAIVTEKVLEKKDKEEGVGGKLLDLTKE